MLPIKVKASSVTNLTDARYFSAWEVDWVGFPLDRSAERFLEPAAVLAMKEWIDGPRIVAEMGFSGSQEILETYKLLGIDLVQVDFLVGLDVLMALPEELGVIKEMILEPGTGPDVFRSWFAQFADHVDWFQLDLSRSGISPQMLDGGGPVDRAFLADLCREYPIILGMDFDPGSIIPLLDAVRPGAISLKGGTEEKTGFKSFDELDELFELLELEDQTE